MKFHTASCLVIFNRTIEHSDSQLTQSYHICPSQGDLRPALAWKSTRSCCQPAPGLSTGPRVLFHIKHVCLHKSNPKRAIASLLADNSTSKSSVYNYVHSQNHVLLRAQAWRNPFVYTAKPAQQKRCQNAFLRRYEANLSAPSISTSAFCVKYFTAKHVLARITALHPPKKNLP